MDPYESPQLDPQAEAAAAGDAAGSPASGEQLGVTHLALYAAGVAVAVWGNGMLLQTLWFPALHSYLLPEVVQSLVIGAGVGAIGLAALRYVQRRPTFPVQFGHWILLAGGTNFLVQVLYEAIHQQALLGDYSEPDPNQVELIQDTSAGLYVLYLVLWCGAASVPALGVWYSRGERWWQRYGIFLALNVAWTGVLPMLGEPGWELLAGTALLRLLALLCLALAIGTDRFRPEPRDRLHWIGIGSLFGLVLSFFLRALVGQLYWLGW